jgi:hypothetical protein
MSVAFPVAAYASTLNPRELHAFVGLPLLKHNPLRAIEVFEAKYRRRAR